MIFLARTLKNGICVTEFKKYGIYGHHLKLIYETESKGCNMTQNKIKKLIW